LADAKVQSGVKPPHSKGAAAPRQGRMTYQLTWKALPGLRGISCSDFRAAATTTPDNERGVAVELATEAERDALLAELEQHFAAPRFSNSATAFETVKAHVLEWATKGKRQK
jgi:hypothetical protein